MNESDEQVKQSFANPLLTPSQLLSPEELATFQTRESSDRYNSLPPGERLDALLDPERRLPHVWFVEDDASVHEEVPIEGGVGYRVTNGLGQLVGVFITGDGQEVGAGEGTAYLKWVSVGEGFQKQGYGKAIYHELLKQTHDVGVTLVSDRQLSHDGLHMWQRLEKLGLVRQTVLYRYDAEGDDFLADSSIFVPHSSSACALISGKQ